MKKANTTTIVKRFNKTMEAIGCDHLMVEKGGEIFENPRYYGVEAGRVTVEWMKKEAKYWLSCYYEDGNCRADDRHDSREAYKTWVSETGRLKRLIKALEMYDGATEISL